MLTIFILLGYFFSSLMMFFCISLQHFYGGFSAHIASLLLMIKDCSAFYCVVSLFSEVILSFCQN